MSIEIGSGAIDDIRLGTDAVDKVMLGGEIIYPSDVCTEYDDEGWGLPDTDPCVFNTNKGSSVRGAFTLGEGSDFYISEDDGDLKQYSLSTPYTLGTIGNVIKTTRLLSGLYSLWFNSDKTQLFGKDEDNARFIVYNITGGDIETSSLAYTYSTDISDMWVNCDGKKAIVLKQDSDGSSRLRCCTFDTPWNLNTLVVPSENLSNPSLSRIRALGFNTSGKYGIASGPDDGSQYEDIENYKITFSEEYGDTYTIDSTSKFALPMHSGIAIFEPKWIRGGNISPDGKYLTVSGSESDTVGIKELGVRS